MMPHSKVFGVRSYSSGSVAVTLIFGSGMNELWRAKFIERLDENGESTPALA
jgi:hypothetical protein